MIENRRRRKYRSGILCWTPNAFNIGYVYMVPSMLFHLYLCATTGFVVHYYCRGLIVTNPTATSTHTFTTVPNIPLLQQPRQLKPAYET